MAIVFGRPGHGATRRGLRLLAVVVGFAILEAALYVLGSGSLAVRALVLLAACAAAVLIWWRRGDARAIAGAARKGRLSLRGRDGEREVARDLATLPEEYVVFHDFHFRAPDGAAPFWSADHVVVGPTGAFVVGTASHSQTRIEAASHDAENRRNVRRIRRCAMDLKDGLMVWSGGELRDVFVDPILVYVQPGAYVEETGEGSVRVIPLRWLRGDIEQRPRHELAPELKFEVAHTLYSQLTEEQRRAFREAHERLSAEWERLDEASSAVATPGGGLDRLYGLETE